MSIVKTGRTFAASVAAVIALGAGGITVANAAEPAPAPAVEWVAPEVNGLAAEQEAEAAAAEAARIEAERVEAERVAAEAAAAEAARIEAARIEADRVAAEKAEAERQATLPAKPAPVAPKATSPSAPAKPAPVVPDGARYDEKTDSMAHTICEVTAEGVAIPCQ